MSYTNIPADLKTAVVKQCMAGAKIARICREKGVSRRSVHYWLRHAERGVEDALKDESDPTKQSSVIAKLRNDNAKLREEILKVRKQVKVLSQKSHLRISHTAPQHEVRPALCLKCRHDEILKNGKYRVKNAERDDVIDGTDLVQRFICKQCGTRVYLSGKKGR